MIEPSKRDIQHLRDTRGVGFEEARRILLKTAILKAARRIEDPAVNECIELIVKLLH